jgi:hypothetical protein
MGSHPVVRNLQAVIGTWKRAVSALHQELEDFSRVGCRSRWRTAGTKNRYSLAEEVLGNSSQLLNLFFLPYT